MHTLNPITPFFPENISTQRKPVISEAMGLDTVSLDRGLQFASTEYHVVRQSSCRRGNDNLEG